MIEHLTEGFSPSDETTLKGIGDDAAVIQAGNGLLVLTTDLLVEGIHFNLVYTPLKHLGYKAVVVNLSDVCAMNARPRQITVSVALSAKFSLRSMEELYAGIRLACEQYGVDLVGGDTSTSLSGLVISVCATGTVQRDRITYRSGASEKDLICVSGDLGAAYTGLQLLERERKIFEESGTGIQPELSGHPYVLERQLRPEARRDITEALEQASLLPGSMIDVSDGLSSDLNHLCKASGLGCRIYQDKIPIHPETADLAAEFHLEPFICALHGGEDYELLFTLPESDREKIAALKEVTVIGHMTAASEGCMMVTGDGALIGLLPRGWDAMHRSRGT